MGSWLKEDDPWLVPGMRAAAEIERAEAELLRAVAAAMAKFLDAARRGVLGEPDSLVAAGVHRVPPGTVMRITSLETGREVMTITAAEEDPPDFGAWPPDSLWIQLVEQYILPAAIKVFNQTFAAVVAGIEVNAEIWRSAYIQTVRDRLSPKLWPRETFNYIRGLVDQSVREGLGVSALRDLISEVLRVTGQINGRPAFEWQARRMARTETMGAYNGGSYNGAQAWEQVTGEQRFKEWFATFDTRTRDTHRIAHGQVVPLDSQFDVGSSSLLFPGDPSGVASEVINCRCTFLVLDAGEAAKQAARYATQTPEMALAASAQPEGETMPPTEGEALPQRWRGVLAPLETMSGDRRILSAPDGQPRVRPLPIPLRYTPADWGEHMGAVVVGSIDRVWAEGGNLMGEGRFDVKDPSAAEVVRKIRDGFHRWVSVDLDDYSAEALCFREGDVIDCENPDLMDEEDWVDVEMGVRVTDWRLAAATLVDIQAFPEAVVELIDDDALVAAAIGNMDLVLADREHDWDGSAAAQRVAEWAKGDGEEIDPDKYREAFFYYTPEEPDTNVGAYKLGFADVIDGELKAIPRGIFAVTGALEGARDGVDIPDEDKSRIRGLVDKYYARMREEFNDPDIVTPWSPAEETEDDAALLASGAPLAPPVEWFGNPELAGATPLTIDDDGRVYGHLATWDTCHIGYPASQCQAPPRSPSGYANFHVGEVKCSDGRLLPVGSLVLGTRHADISATYAAAMTHYSDSGHAVAVVRAGEDNFGIWVAGALVPDVDETKIATLRRSPLSGDWRVVNGQRDLAAALAVNVPGFPVRRERVEAGQTVALVAAGVIPPQRGPREAVARASTTREFAREVAAEIRALDEAERLTAAAEVDRKTRADAAAASMREVRAAAINQEMKGALDVRV